MNPPPLPYDQFPIAVRLVGRPALETLWSGCFYAGVGSALTVGFVAGILFAAVLGIAVRNLQDRAAARDRIEP